MTLDSLDLKVTQVDVAEDGVATLTLDRPGRGNSWTGRMHDEIREICAMLDADPAVRVIVLTGAGEKFGRSSCAMPLEKKVGC